MSKFKYDVAFSFLAQDESLAQRLADIVSERYEVFLYSEKQKELAGKDGEQEFANIFTNQARVVVVFYREKWGKTSWTRIEETAIRNRAHELGYDFALFIPLDDIKSIPSWMPKNRLYYDLERFGEQSTAAVIIARITDQLGEARQDSVVDEAKRLQIDLNFKQEVQQWETSHEGVQQVIASAESLYLEIEKQINLITSENPAAAFQIEKGTRRDLVIYHPPISMTLDLNISYANSMKGVCLHVRHWNGKIVRSHSIVYFREPEVTFEEEFIPELTREKNIRWRSRSIPSRTYSNKALLEHCMKGLINSIRES